MRVIFATVLFGVRISISCQLINVNFVEKINGVCAIGVCVEVWQAGTLPKRSVSRRKDLSRKMPDLRR